MAAPAHGRAAGVVGEGRAPAAGLVGQGDGRAARAAAEVSGPAAAMLGAGDGDRTALAGERRLTEPPAPSAPRPVAGERPAPSAPRPVVGEQPGVSAPRSVAAAPTGLERYRLAHRALPGRDLAEIGLATPLLGAVLAAPLLIAVPDGVAVGRLARAASEHGLGLVLRSAELLRDPDSIARYRTPDRPPLLLASIGLELLLDGDGPERAERVVGMLDADGLVVELDAIAAATEPGGDPRFRRALSTLTAVVTRLAPLPVVVREPGSGMDGADARALQEVGVAAIDAGGAGGRGRDDASFEGWGVPTADAVAEAVLLAPGLPVIAGGPLRDGVEVATCLALGAAAACLERPFAEAPPEAAGETAAALVHQLRVAVWAAGAPNAAALGPGHLRVRALA